MSMVRLTVPGVTKHTELLEKEILGIIDHADASIFPPKLSATNAPTDGYAPLYDAASGRFRWGAAGGAYDPWGRKFFSASYGGTLLTAISGSGYISGNYVSRLRLGTGTTANSYIVVYFYPGWRLDKNTEVGVDVITPTSLPTVNWQHCILGYGRSYNPSYTASIYAVGFWIVKDATYDNRLLCVTQNGAYGQTITDLGTFPVNTPMSLRIEVKQDVTRYYKDNVLVAEHPTPSVLWSTYLALIFYTIANTTTDDLLSCIYSSMRVYQDY